MRSTSIFVKQTKAGKFARNKIPLLSATFVFTAKAFEQIQPVLAYVSYTNDLGTDKRKHFKYFA